MKYLSDVKLNGQEWDQNKIDMISPVCKLLLNKVQTQMEKKLLDMVTSQYFAGLSILASQIDAENFKSISWRSAIVQNNL